MIWLRVLIIYWRELTMSKPLKKYAKFMKNVATRSLNLT